MPAKHMEIMEQQEIISKIIGVLKLIDRRDYEIFNERFIPDQINDEGYQFSTYENNFVTKFNEVYARQEFAGVIPNRLDLHRQLQIPKRFIYSDCNDPIVERFYNKLQKRFGHEVNGKMEFETIPDFFIHKDQTDKNSENQKLIMEFKTESNLPINRFMWDFFKLNLYLEKFNYQLAIFVSINNSKERIKGLLNQYIKENHYRTS
jgi:hypothetical protein